MDRNLVPTMVVAGALVLCGGGWLALPHLQDAQRRADSQAAIHVERARRLLEKYDAGWEQKSLLLDRLAGFDVDVEVENPQTLIDARADDYQAKHEKLWEAFQPMDWQAVPREARANYGNLERQIEDGISGRDDIIGNNRQLLDGALEEVDAALSVTVGESSSREYAEAVRLKSVIFYHKGVCDWLAAGYKRVDAEPYRRELVALAIEAAALAGDTSLVEKSGVDEMLAVLKEKVVQARASLDRDRGELAKLDEIVRSFRSRIEAAEANAETALKALTEIGAGGVDFTDPDGAESFRSAILRQDELYRKAARELRSLKAGALPNAQIDYTMDFLRGRYVEDGSYTDLTVEHGLRHYEGIRNVLSANVTEQERALADFDADIARLEGMRNSYVEAGREAAERLSELGKRAEETYSALNQVESEASAMEEGALDLFDRAARSAARAAALAKRSAAEGWMAGHISAQEADALLAKARVLLGAYQGRSQTANAIRTALRHLSIAEADADAESAGAEDAREAAVEDIVKAIKLLQQAHVSTNKNWTLVAQEAEALYLLSLFGMPSYREDAIQAYRNALKGREQEKYVQTFIGRLTSLEGRQNQPE